jgi:hypothetical protein
MARRHAQRTVRRRVSQGFETLGSLIPTRPGKCPKTHRSPQSLVIPAALDAIPTLLCEILAGNRLILRKKNNGESGDIVNGSPGTEMADLARRGDPVTS